MHLHETPSGLTKHCYLMTWNENDQSPCITLTSTPLFLATPKRWQAIFCIDKGFKLCADLSNMKRIPRITVVSSSISSRKYIMTHNLKNKTKKTSACASTITQCQSLKYKKKLVLTYLPKASSVSRYFANLLNSLLSSDSQETHIILVQCAGRHTCLFHKHKRASQREMKRCPHW